VTGTRFAAAGTVRWDGENRTTTYVSPFLLRAEIPASDLDVAGIVPVTVENPGPAGGLSDPWPFTVFSIPAITGISPSRVSPGSAAFNLTVNGSQFDPSCTVQWNGANRNTTWISAGQLNASIAAPDVASPGARIVRVLNPGPAGGLSNQKLLTVR
jgi:hypothetical protein